MFRIKAPINEIEATTENKDCFSDRARITVTIDQVAPYDNNPRLSANPNYDSIKASIRERGLDHPFNVTRRTQSEKFMIKDGGNTRLKILHELWQETKDMRFYKLEVDFHPWVSELDTLAGHMVENEIRGATTFIERALAAKQLRKLLEEKSGYSLSMRELADQISAIGCQMQAGNISRYEYAANNLWDLIPDALEAGAGHDLITCVRKYNKSYRSLFLQIQGQEATNEEYFDLLWQNTLKDHDAVKINLDAVRADIAKRIAEYTDHTLRDITFWVDAVIAGEDVSTVINIAPNITTENHATESSPSSPINISSIKPNGSALADAKLKNNAFIFARSIAFKYGDIDHLIIDESEGQADGYGFQIKFPDATLDAQSNAAYIWWLLYSLSIHSVGYTNNAMDENILNEVAERVFGSPASLMNILSSMSFFLTDPKNRKLAGDLYKIERIVADLRSWRLAQIKAV